MYGSFFLFLIKGSTLTLTGGGGVCRGDTSWATPDGINMHKEVAPNGLSYYMLKPHLSQQITVNKCLVENTVGI